MGAFALAACLALSAAPAFAHALLQSASPPVGGTVSPPSAITLHFSEAIEPKFSDVALSGPKGAVPVGRPSVPPDDGAAMVVKIAIRLAAGVYTVSWRVVSVDTHHTQGHFDFTVK